MDCAICSTEIPVGATVVVAYDGGFAHQDKEICRAIPGAKRRAIPVVVSSPPSREANNESEKVIGECEVGTAVLVNPNDSWTVTEGGVVPTPERVALLGAN